MSLWPTMRLDEVCELNPRFPRDHDVPDAQPVSFVPMASVDEVAGRIATSSVRPFAEVRRGFTNFRDRDVLFAKITPCMENGKAALAENLSNALGFGSTEFHVLRAGAQVLPEWLFYFVRRPSFRVEARRNFTGTAGQQRVPAAFLCSSVIPVPPLCEQRKILDVLTRAESILRMRREAQEKAAELVPAIFISMFGDPASNPRSWPIVTLGDLLAEPPTLGTMAKPSAAAGGWLDLRVANIQGGKLDLSDKKWLDLPDDQVARFSLRSGDVLLARAIGSLDHLGKAVIVDPSSPWTFDSHLMRLRFMPSRMLPEFFKAFLESKSGREEFLKHTRRSAVQFNINGKEVRQISIPLPPLSLQSEFLARWKEVAGISKLQSDGLARAEAMFHALLSSAFEGDSRHVGAESEEVSFA